MVLTALDSLKVNIQQHSVSLHENLYSPELGKTLRLTTFQAFVGRMKEKFKSIKDMFADGVSSSQVALSKAPTGW